MQRECRNGVSHVHILFCVFPPNTFPLLISVSVPSSDPFFYSSPLSWHHFPSFHLSFMTPLLSSPSPVIHCTFLVMFSGRSRETNMTMRVCHVHKWISHTWMQNNYCYHTEIKDALAEVLNRGLSLWTSHPSAQLSSPLSLPWWLFSYR